MRRRRLAPAALLLALAACEPAGHGQVGRPAPAYAAPTLEGDTVRLADLRGRPVLLNVWATWCPPCRTEIPVLQRIHERYGPRGLQVVGVSIDAAGTEYVVRLFAREAGMTYTVLHDPEERIARTFRLRGVPVTLLIGRDGTVLWRHNGPVRADDPALAALLERALAPAPGPARVSGTGTGR